MKVETQTNKQTTKQVSVQVLPPPKLRKKIRAVVGQPTEKIQSDISGGRGISSLSFASGVGELPSIL